MIDPQIRLEGRTLVVVFGAAVRRDGSASPTLARRAGYAAAVTEADPRTDLFLSGGIGRFAPSEAVVMADLLLGAVDEDRLILDEVSGDTLETVRAATAYFRAHDYAAILTCTDAYHQPREDAVPTDGTEEPARSAGVARIEAAMDEDVAARGCSNPLRLRGWLGRRATRSALSAASQR